MNKADLIDAITETVGDKRTASVAVDAVLATIERTVAAGNKVAVPGFGVFERVDRAARTARNPATGAAVQLEASSVPRFRPAQRFKEVVRGDADAPELPPAEPRSVARATGARTTSAVRGAGTPAAPAPAPPTATDTAPQPDPTTSQPPVSAAAASPSPASTATAPAPKVKAAGKARAGKSGAKKAESKADNKKADNKKADAKKAKGKKARKSASGKKAK